METAAALRHCEGMTQLIESEMVVPHLYASAPAPLPFGRDLVIRAFTLERAGGNLLIYSTPTAHGGAWRQYLNHAHEAAFTSEAVNAPLFVHVADRAAVEQTHHVRASFSRRHMLDDDFEVIPTPGHTPGATAYLWDSGEHRVLFPGDTLFLRGGEWATAVLDSSDRDAYRDSLELIRGLEFDLLVPWAATAGDPFHAVTDHKDTERRIDALIERIG